MLSAVAGSDSPYQNSLRTCLMQHRQLQTISHCSALSDISNPPNILMVPNFSAMLKGMHDEMNDSKPFKKRCGRILKIQHPTFHHVLWVAEI